MTDDKVPPFSGAGLSADTYRDKTPIKCLWSGSFWMLISINAIGSGAGLTFLNNLGEEVSRCAGACLVFLSDFV